jgi:hypothetical protein
MTETIVPNDVRKGWLVIYRDGTIAKVLDNGKGISRRVEIDGDSGSGYVFEWDVARVGNETPKLIRQPGSYLLKKITIQRAGLL